MKTPTYTKMKYDVSLSYINSCIVGKRMGYTPMLYPYYTLWYFNAKECIWTQYTITTGCIFFAIYLFSIYLSEDTSFHLEILSLFFFNTPEK